MNPKMTPAQADAALATMTDADFPTATPDEWIDDATAARLVEAGRNRGGRPSLSAPGARSPQITLRLPESVNKRLTDVAARTGRRRSQIVRDALDAYLAA